jgi:hypothetical protein
MNNLLNTAVAGIVVVFVAFFGANAAHSAGCSNQTIHVDGELVYVSSKCTWNDAPASQDLLDQMTWGANLADSDNGPKADVVEATEEVVVGGGEASGSVVKHKRSIQDLKDIIAKVNTRIANISSKKVTAKRTQRIAKNVARVAKLEKRITRRSK